MRRNGEHHKQESECARERVGNNERRPDERKPAKMGGIYCGWEYAIENGEIHKCAIFTNTNTSAECMCMPYVYYNRINREICCTTHTMPDQYLWRRQHGRSVSWLKIDNGVAITVCNSDRTLQHGCVCVYVIWPAAVNVVYTSIHARTIFTLSYAIRRSAHI